MTPTRAVGPRRDLWVKIGAVQARLRSHVIGKLPSRKLKGLHNVSLRIQVLAGSDFENDDSCDEFVRYDNPTEEYGFLCRRELDVFDTPPCLVEQLDFKRMRARTDLIGMTPSTEVPRHRSLASEGEFHHRTEYCSAPTFSRTLLRRVPL